MLTLGNGGAREAAVCSFQLKFGAGVPIEYGSEGCGQPPWRIGSFMKLRPVVLVLLILCGFYYLSTRLFPAGTIAGAIGRAMPGVGPTVSRVTGPLGDFGLTEAAAAPAFDSEEQQNIAVYKKALPSVVNITSTQVAVRLSSMVRCRSRARDRGSSWTSRA